MLNLFNQKNCTYREGNTYFYSPRIHARVGVFIDYDAEKQKHLDEQKQLRQQKKYIKQKAKTENL